MELNENKTQVLIVGAGPTGLATAAYLAKHGIKIRIIDKCEKRTDKSKALGVQSGTLECIDHFLDRSLTQKLIDFGFAARSASFHLDNLNPIEVDLSSILPPYSFILVLAQSETERILEEYLNTLGVAVERGTELLKINETENSTVAVIRTNDGMERSVESNFSIGCDGAHSVVRKQLNIPFVGDQYPGDFVLRDVKIKWDWSYQSIRVFISENGVMVSFPMKGDQYRLILIPKAKQPSNTLDISFDEFKLTTNLLSGNQIQVLDSSWLTRFRIHHRLVESYQKGRIFLAGDAAHIHSPAGGQGMNIGIQEGLNLAIKLRSTILKNAPMSILEKYEKERRPIAKAVLRYTDFAFKMALINENRLVKWGRNSLLPRLIRTPWLQKKVARAVSEIGIARAEINRAREQGL